MGFIKRFLYIKINNFFILKHLINFQLFEKSNYFKGSHFSDDDGNTWSVEKVYKFVKKNKEKYYHQRFDLDKIKHNLKWWKKLYSLKNPDHKERMLNADTKFPILVIKDGDNLSVCDGLNRLWKAIKIEDRKTLPVYLFDKEDILHLKKKK